VFKYVKVPEPVELPGNLPGGRRFTYSLAEGIAFVVDHAAQFSRPQSRVRAAARLVEAFSSAAPGEIVELKQDDWEVLSATVEAGDTPWGKWQATLHDKEGKAVDVQDLEVAPRIFLPFANAIAEAANQDPRPPPARGTI
jgi:hypothetical protein